METIKTWKWNDLIKRYILEKIKNGYEVRFTMEEIEDFLSFIRQIVKIKQNVIVPTYDLFCSKEEKNVKDELSSYYHFYLEKHCAKRKIIEREELDEDTIAFGENVAALLVMKIWENRKSNYQEHGFWPYQCNDIQKYLIDDDLSPIIGLPAIREELIDLYLIVSKRIMHVAQNDRSFKMTNFSNKVLAKSNFDLILEGYENYSYFRKEEQYGIIVDREENELQTINGFYDGNIRRDKLNTTNNLALVKSLKSARIR